jgi:hypothetical protein
MAKMKWTRDAPKADGSYWWRHDETDPAWDVHLVKDGCFEYCGREGRITVSTFGGEWLGPITPAHVFTQTDLDTAVAAARGEVWNDAIKVAQLSVKKSIVAGISVSAAEILIRRLERARNAALTSASE